jgi:hypothetical protein
LNRIIIIIDNHFTAASNRAKASRFGQEEAKEAGIATAREEKRCEASAIPEHIRKRRI